jgi:hypothetical protein
VQRIYFLLLAVSCIGRLNAQVYDYSIGRETEKVDSVLQWIYDYEQLGPKPYGSATLEKTRDWIVAKYKEFGYTEIQLDTFYYASNQGENIIVEKPGQDTTRWIILGAHYDSVTESPGANDNGTGVIACLQIAKILRDIPCEVGIRFVHFSAEEVGLIGSKSYVANTLSTNDLVELVLNLDQLGGTKGADNSSIYCERDEDGSPSVNNALSHLKTDTLANLIQIYTSLKPIISRAYSSDYMSFEDSGYVITGLYQASDYPHYHTSNDITANVDVAATTEVIRGALAATMHFARNRLPVSVAEKQNADFSVVPNPASKNIRIHSSINQEYRLEISNALGQRVFVSSAFTSDLVDVSNLENGLYFTAIYDQAKLVHQSKLIIAAD